MLKGNKITILTEPTHETPMTNVHAFKRYVKTVLGHALRGPSAVLRSLTEGFKGEGIHFNYNPKSIKEIGDVVVVLSHIEALREAIELKRSGKIKKILAGPNLMNLSNEFDGILASGEIDICLVPCEWVQVAYEEDNPALVGRIRVWPAGVDEKFWHPKKIEKSKEVLIYWKTESEEFIRGIENKLGEFGYKPFRIRYSKYSRDEFREKLSRALFSVFVSKSESQGIALAESWAMDVPTLVWNPKPSEINGRIYSCISSSPYLNSRLGVEWKTMSDLESLLKQMGSMLCQFQPREWVLENMTDKVSAQLLLKMISHDKDE